MLGRGAEDPYMVGGRGRRPVEKVSQFDVVELGEAGQSTDRDI